MSLLRQIGLGCALLAALAGWYFINRYRLHNAQQEARQATAHAQDLAGELKAARQDVRIVTRYVDRVHTVREHGRTLIKKVPVYVPDAACRINRGFVRLHNAAAQGTDLPATAGSIDAAPADIGIAAVAGTVVHNYTEYRALATQLKALQAWARAHSAPPATATGPP